MPGEHTFYDGSVRLQPLADIVGIPVDQVNFVLCMFSSLPLAFVYRKFLAADKVSRQIRTLVPLLIGISFCFFCFGRAVKHLLANALISYAVMYLAPAKHVHKIVFVFSMGYLLFIHFYRFLILTSYVLDITGPIMVAVQKITTLAFSLHDGKGRKREELSKYQKKEAITEVPSLLDYMSYLFNFQTVLTGPVNFFADYMSFLDGTHLPKGKNGKTPCPVGVSLRKCAEAMFYLLLIVNFSAKYGPTVIAEKEYLDLPYLQWFGWWFIVIFLVRVTYYFAWVFADSVCNMSGFGFSGFNKEGEAEWELCTNVKPVRVEMAESLKETLDMWNIQTAGWLRRCAYDRAPKKVRMVATYALSAVWHGVSVGYYMAFFTCALLTVTGSTVRRCMRWRFVDSPLHKKIYDFFTFLATKISLAYLTYAFVTMNFQPAFSVYSRIYFCIHVIGVLMIYGVPLFFRPLKKPDPVAAGKKTDEIKKEL